MKTASLTAASDTIRAAVLKGRKIVQKTSAASAPPMSPEQSRAALDKFAGMLETLSNARNEMDKADKLAADSNGLDLADLLERGETLPDLGSLANNAEAARLRAAASLQVCNRLLPAALASMTRLEQEKRATLNRIETDVRAGIERPSWMSPRDFEISVMNAPQVAEIRSMAWIHTPRLPSVRGNKGSVVLPDFRVTPLSEWQKVSGSSGDLFSPGEVAGHIRRWLLHLEEVNALGGKEAE